MLEHLQESQHDLSPHPGVAKCEHMGPQCQHRPDLARGELVSYRDRVRSQEPVLEGR